MSQKVSVDLSSKLTWAVLLLSAGAVIYSVFFAWQTLMNVRGSYPREISVEGKGTAMVAPDLAEVNLGVESRAESSEAATKANNEAMNKVTAKLKELGVKAEDIKTTNYSVYPNYNYSPEGVATENGFIARQDVLVKVRELAKAGEILAAATAAGANSVGGINFTVENQDAALAEARAEAIEKAKAKAEAIEAASGFNLGRMTNYWEYSDPYYGKGGYAEGAMMDASVANIEPGTQEITLTVTLTYRLRP